MKKHKKMPNQPTVPELEAAKLAWKNYCEQLQAWFDSAIDDVANGRSIGSNPPTPPPPPPGH